MGKGLTDTLLFQRTSFLQLEIAQTLIDLTVECFSSIVTERELSQAFGDHVTSPAAAQSPKLIHSFVARHHMSLVLIEYPPKLMISAASR